MYRYTVKSPGFDLHVLDNEKQLPCTPASYHWSITWSKCRAIQIRCKHLLANGNCYLLLTPSAFVYLRHEFLNGSNKWFPYSVQGLWNERGVKPPVITALLTGGHHNLVFLHSGLVDIAILGSLKNIIASPKTGLITEVFSPRSKGQV